MVNGEGDPPPRPDIKGDQKRVIEKGFLIYQSRDSLVYSGILSGRPGFRITWEGEDMSLKSQIMALNAILALGLIASAITFVVQLIIGG